MSWLPQSHQALSRRLHCFPQLENQAHIRLHPPLCGLKIALLLCLVSFPATQSGLRIACSIPPRKQGGILFLFVHCVNIPCGIGGAEGGPKTSSRLRNEGDSPADLLHPGEPFLQASLRLDPFSAGGLGRDGVQHAEDEVVVSGCFSNCCDFPGEAVACTGVGIGVSALENATEGVTGCSEALLPLCGFTLCVCVCMCMCVCVCACVCVCVCVCMRMCM